VLFTSSPFKPLAIGGAPVRLRRRIILWSGADNPMPDKLHTAHDAITSCHFSPDDRLLAVGTQVGGCECLCV